MNITFPLKKVLFSIQSGRQEKEKLRLLYSKFVLIQKKLFMFLKTCRTKSAMELSCCNTKEQSFPYYNRKKKESALEHRVAI